jgi:hypothetical protein
VRVIDTGLGCGAAKKRHATGLLVSITHTR